MKKSILPLLAVSAVLTSLTASPLKAVTVNNSATAPTENVILSIAPEGTLNQRWQWIDYTTVRGHNDAGQTFQAPIETDTLLQSITFQVSNVNGGIGAGASEAPFHLRIYEFTNASAVTPGDLVHTESGTLPAVISPLDYLSFTLDESIRLEAGKHYGVVLFFTEPLANRGLSFVNDNNTSYADGQGVFYSNRDDAAVQTWRASGGDFKMVLTATAIPEPGSVSLLLGFGLPLAAGFWRMRAAKRKSE